jgi:hypothetical protein
MQQDNFTNGHMHQAVADATESGFSPRYLAAKKGIDDRALNHHVWETLRRFLPQSTGHEAVKILEIGAGIGTMLERVIDRGLLTGPATYIATDSDPDQLQAARKYLSVWAARQGHAMAWSAEFRGLLHTANAPVSLVLHPAGAEELADGPDTHGPFHLIIAHAVLDLVDFPALLPGLLSRLKNRGLAYLTCNFDGETIFLPAGDGDEEIISQYHASMEARLTGASHTGRRLLEFLQGPGMEILAAGSSDWVVHPCNGRYSTDEALFLHAIVETIERELAKNPIPPTGLAAWADRRHSQIDTGELSFLARHLDLLVCRLPS